MKNNRKRLNNKGFTLIELLAVVVILAIVMGITGNAVLNSINNSRKSTLHSAAQTAANTLNTWISEDMLVNNDIDRKLGNDFVKATQTTSPNIWICLGSNSIKMIKNGGTEAELIKALGLSEKDIKIDSSFEAETKDAAGKITGNPKCSALRYNKTIGGYELLLVAQEGGKYYVSNDTTQFAYSRAQGPNMSNVD